MFMFVPVQLVLCFLILQSVTVLKVNSTAPTTDDPEM